MNTKTSLFSDTDKGFRLWKSDPPLLLGSLAAGLVFYEQIGSFSYLGFYVMAHYFLFCNVFRIRLILELVWAVALLAQFALLLRWNSMDMGTLLATQAPVTLLCILWEMAAGHYRGIFHEKFPGKS